MKIEKLFAFLFCLLLFGCGSTAHPVGFVNKTPQPDSFLWAQWQAAQAHVVQGGEDLSSVRTQQQHTSPQILRGDPRGPKIEPHGLLVQSLPNALPNLWVVKCPQQSCDLPYASAYSMPGISVVYADGLDPHPAWLAPVLQYEFTTQILYQLGYDVSWR